PIREIAGEPADVCLLRQIRPLEFDPLIPGYGPDLLDDPLTLCRIPPDHYDRRTLARQLSRRHEADAGSGSGDHADLAFQEHTPVRLRRASAVGEVGASILKHPLRR